MVTLSRHNIRPITDTKMYHNFRNTAQAILMCVLLLTAAVASAQKIEVFGLTKDSLIWKKICVRDDCS